MEHALQAGLVCGMRVGMVRHSRTCLYMKALFPGKRGKNGIPPGEEQGVGSETANNGLAVCVCNKGVISGE